MNPQEEIVLETETEEISLAEIDAMLDALEQLCQRLAEGGCRREIVAGEPR